MCEGLGGGKNALEKTDEKLTLSMEETVAWLGVVKVDVEIK